MNEMNIQDPLAAKIFNAKALFIDIDGTAVNSEPIIRDVIEELAANAGYQFQPEDWDGNANKRGLAGIGDREVGAEIAARSVAFKNKYPTGEAFEHARLERYFQRISETEANQPVLDLTTAFIESGKEVIAVTNSPHHLAESHLAQTGYPVQEMGLISQENAYDRGLQPKPDPALYDMAFHRTGLKRLDRGEAGRFKRKDCLVLEDSGTGVKAGLAAGMMTVQFTDMCKELPDTDVKRFTKGGATFHAIKFDRLAGILSPQRVLA